MDTQKVQTPVNAADAAHQELIQATEDLSEVSRVQHSSAKRFFVAEPATPAGNFDVVENIWEAHHILSESHEHWGTFRTEEEADAECTRLNDDYDHQRAKELELSIKCRPVSQEKLYWLPEEPGWTT